jgi:3-isopropylmalate/(R)-2-methylmalate dehydratase small subunit
MTVDMNACKVRVPGLEPIAISLPESQRVALPKGQEDVDQAVARESRIVAFQRADRAMRPRVYATA